MHPPTPQQGPDMTMWNAFTTALYRSGTICLFLGLMTLEPVVHLLGAENIAKQATLQTFVSVGLLNGLVIALLVALFQRMQDIRTSGGLRLLLRPARRVRMRRMTILLGFLCGLLSEVHLLTFWGLAIIALIVVALVIWHVRVFLRRVIHILSPGTHPSWSEVGELLHLYISVICAFTLINTNLVVLHLQFGWQQAFGPQANSLYDMFYFTVVMMTTLGFGDIAPTTEDARLVVALQVLVSYVMFALMIGAVTRGIVTRKEPG